MQNMSSFYQNFCEFVELWDVTICISPIILKNLQYPSDKEKVARVDDKISRPRHDHNQQCEGLMSDII